MYACINKCNTSVELLVDRVIRGLHSFEITASPLADLSKFVVPAALY